MEIELKEANCTGLKLSAPVQMLKQSTDSENEITNFLIKAYTGETVDRWWGKLAIDVSGIQAKNQIPIFMNHDPDKIIGYSNETRKDLSFWVEGQFSTVTEESKQVKALAQEGFPWQASIGVRAKKIMSLEEDSEHLVNGNIVKGPAEVWLESEVFETSFVPLGADANTSIATFSQFYEKNRKVSNNIDKNNVPDGITKNHKEEIEIMEKTEAMTMAKLEKEYPDLVIEIMEKAESKGLETGIKQGTKEGFASGTTHERERIQSVLEQSLPGHDDLIQKLAFDGKTTGAEAAVKVLAAEKLMIQNARENLQDESIKPVDQSPAEETQQTAITAENFAQHKDLVDEFGSYGVYEAYNNAMEQGIVKTTGGK